MSIEDGGTEDPSYWEENVRQWTQFVQTDADPLAGHARAELRSRGVEPQEIVVAWFIPQGRGLFQLLVLVPEGQVYEMYIRDPRGGRRTTGPTEWRDVTGRRFGFPAALEAARWIQRSGLA
jgi:hypothetical protein